MIGWYKEARKWNQVILISVVQNLVASILMEAYEFYNAAVWLLLQTAIPVMIGTKFDDFIQLPIDLQWTIASEVNIST